MGYSFFPIYPYLPKKFTIMKYLFTTILVMMTMLCLSQTYQEGKAAYDAGEYEKAFEILKQVPESSKDYNKAQRLKDDTQQRLIEVAREKLLEEQKEKEPGYVKPQVQTRFLTEDEIKKKQKQLKSSATRLTLFSILGAGTALAANVVDPDNARPLLIAAGVFGVLTSIETIVFVNKSANLTAGIAPGQIRFQIKF